jgi:3-hydroxypropanoate dehydrogenase
MKKPLDTSALAQLFTAARSHNDWHDRAISDSDLQHLYDIWKYGPTSANCSPARVVFVRSEAARERLMPHLSSGNQAKTCAAPVCAIIGYDVKFYDRIPELFPHAPSARDWFTESAEFADTTALRNSTLQGAYLMIAARAMGLDVGPMSGFDAAGVEREFFPDGDIRANFLCSLGLGKAEAVFERLPRLAFDDACELA